MAAGARGALGIVSWVLVAGAVVLMFFVVLSGYNTSTPLGKIYFLRADTSSFTGARSISQWTYFYVCDDGNTNCGNAVPALPFGYAWVDDANNVGVPAELVGDHAKGTTSTYYYYMWRFGWVFFLIGLVFACLTILTGLVSCTRLGSGLSSLMAMSASFFTAVAACLMTVTFVKARNVFRNNNLTAEIGTYAFAFTWASTVALFFAAILFFGGCFVGRHSDGVSDRKSSFRRSKSTRSRGSFVDTESQRRVKEEY